MIPWSVADVADVLEAGIRRAEADLCEEQAVYGLDALDELGLHPILSQALSAGGYGVHREVRYPADQRRRRESEGERCDFVLTQEGRRLRETERRRTLFDSPDCVEPDEAFWLEIKTAWQFSIDGPNPRYASQMLSVARQDVLKLSKDTGILHAGLAMVCFVESEAIARHDLDIWYQRYLKRGLPVSYPSVRVASIANRVGNSVCAIALAQVNRL